MKKRNITAILAIGCITLLGSCAKEGPTGPTGPAGPSYTGNINGHVSLYDKYGSKILSNLDSTTITLTGTTTGASATATVVSDVLGYYGFGIIYTGSYNLTATHTGYAPTELVNFPFVLGTLTKDIKLSAIPDSFITSFHANHNSGSLYDSLVITVTADPQPRNCIVFLNNTPAVSNFYVNGYLLSYIHTIPANATSVTILVSKDELTSAGFVSGTSEVYYAAYSYVVNDGSVYEDVASGKNIYNAVNTNPTIDSAIAP